MHTVIFRDELFLGVPELAELFPPAADEPGAGADEGRADDAPDEGMSSRALGARGSE